MSSERARPARRRAADPRFVAFSVAGAERARLERVAATFGYREIGACAVEIFRVGLRELATRLEPVRHMPPAGWRRARAPRRAEARDRA